MSLLPGDQKRMALYKYRTINKNTIDIIENHRIYFSFPSDFNDPFDCYVNMVYNGTTTDFENWINQLPGTASDKAIVRNLLKKNGYNGSILVGKEVKNDTKDMVVLCLAEEPDNIVLWNNYANNHKGICIGLKTKIEDNSLGIQFDDLDLTLQLPRVTKGFLPTTKVIYTPKMPKEYNRLKDDISVLTEFLKTKHSKWSYEEERRILYPFNKINKHGISFDKSSLESVIFGMNVDPIEQKNITNIINQEYIKLGQTVNLYKAEMVADQYKLNIVNI